jgi:uncharacterized protein (DUF2384 family)
MVGRPPFRADHVGRLLRRAELREARARRAWLARTHHGNTLSEDERWRKLARVVEVARQVWGE